MFSGLITGGHGTDVQDSQLESESLFMFFSGNLFSAHFSLKAIPIHSMWKVNCGGSTPNWLRAAQLKAGGGCSVEFKNSF